MIPTVEKKDLMGEGVLRNKNNNHIMSEVVFNQIILELLEKR